MWTVGASVAGGKIDTLKRLVPLGGLVALLLLMAGCPFFNGEEPSAFEPADKPLVEYLELTAENLGDCPGILDQPAAPGATFTFRDLARSQYEASLELKKAKATGQYVDTVKIYDELEDVFWDVISIPIGMIAGGAIEAYGTEALKVLWKIKESLGAPQLAIDVSQLLAEILDVEKDRLFLSQQNAVYLKYVS